MLVTQFADGKSEPEGHPICIAEGVPIYKCRSMIYWLRWGGHTFDIRIMWAELGLKDEEYGSQSFYENFINAIKDKNFQELMKRHDESILRETR